MMHVMAGRWITSDDFEVVKDDAGNTNNILRVTALADTSEAAAEASQNVISAQRTPSPTATGHAKDGKLAAAFSPLRFGLEVIFVPFRFLLRLVGLL